jgi:hypothetical protein
MTEEQRRIMQALTELLHGKGAHVDPIACIEDLDSEFANRRIGGSPHSIADLVFHMSYWMNYELKRVRGEKPRYPEHNSESFPSTPQSWGQLKRDFSWFVAEFAKLSKSPRQETRELLSLPRSREQFWELSGFVGPTRHDLCVMNDPALPNVFSTR